MLDAIGDRAAYVGPIDSATVAKLVHNMSATRLSARSPKPSTLGVKAAMDPFTLWQAVRLERDHIPSAGWKLLFLRSIYMSGWNPAKSDQIFG